jgi:pyrimidine deaminase RibD-like protein
LKLADCTAPAAAACTVTLPKAVGVMVVEAKPVASVSPTQLAAAHAPSCALPEATEKVTGSPATGVTPSPRVIRTANGVAAAAITATVPDGADTSTIWSGAMLL